MFQRLWGHFQVINPLNFNLYGFLKSFTLENDLREVEPLFAFMIIIITCLSKKFFIREEYGVNNFWNNPLSKYTAKLYSGLFNVVIPPNSHSSALLSNTRYYNFFLFLLAVTPVCQTSISDSQCNTVVRKET